MVSVLLMYVLATPLTGHGTIANRLINVVVIATMLAIIRLSWPGHPVQAVAAGLGIAAILPAMGFATTAGTVEVASHVAAILFNLIVIGATLKQVLTTQEVTLDTVIGAASVYVLIGLLWGAFFVLLVHWAPGSFIYATPFQPLASPSLMPLMRDTAILYYSFETLTTIGYGDIVPGNGPARFFSVCEALVGQLYLAVLVARFVGLQVTYHTGREGKGGR
jgi:hypothetical protein